MAVIRLQHTSVPMTTGGNDRAREFYGGILGLTEIAPPAVLGSERFVWFTIGDSGDEVHVYTDDRGPGSKSQHLCLQYDDPETVKAKLAAAGFPTDPTDEIPNRPRFFTTDPFGNRVEIAAILGQYS